MPCKQEDGQRAAGKKGARLLFFKKVAWPLFSSYTPFSSHASPFFPRSLLSGLILLLFLSVFSGFSQEETERGTFSIYFMDEKVGYEEYIWQADETGYNLSLSGRMTKPIAVEIERLTIRLDNNFIPLSFYFKGRLSGMSQEVFSSIEEGQVENTILVSGHEQKNTVKIKRDAFLLPNPIFSPYMILTKKFRCTLQESVTLSAYIIPQVEIDFTLESEEESPCILIMHSSGMEIELETDEEGKLISLHIPSQRLRVVQSQY